jgi:SRSO17 transposase
MGCAGRVANGINTVHLSYVREGTGHALIGARQWIPEEQVADPVKALVTGLPLDLRFRTKGQLAIDIVTGACADGLSFGFIRAAGLRWPAEECFESGKGYFGLDQCQARLYTAIRRHLVLVMAALAICAVTAARLRDRTDAQAPPPASPDQPPPADPGLIPLTVHRARSRWFHKRARLARNYALVS